MLSAINASLRRVIGAGGAIATTLTLVMAFSICADVIVRMITRRNVAGLLDFNETLLVMIVFLGAGYAELRGEHIRMTLVTDRVSAPLAKSMRAISSLVMIILLAWILYATLGQALHAIEFNEVRIGTIRWPLWPAKITIVVGTILWLVAAIITLRRRPHPTDFNTVI